MGFNFIKQIENNDCGPTCIRMVAKHFKKDVSLAYIQKCCEYNKGGITIKDIGYCFERIGMKSITIKVNLEDLYSLPLPAIILLNKNHYVVLYKITKHKSRKSFYVADPGFGKVVLNESVILGQWFNKNGIVVLAEPIDKIKCYCLEDERKKKTIGFVQKYKQHKFAIIVSFFLIIISTICNWSIPQIFQKIVDNGIISANVSVIFKLAISQGILIFSYLFCSNVSGLILTKMNLSVGVEYMEKLLNKYMRLPMSLFETKIRTDYIQRLSDQNRIQSFLSFKIIDFTYYILNAIVFFALLYYYNSVIFVVFLLISVISLAWTMLFIESRKVCDFRKFSEQTINSNIIYEMICGMAEVKINSAEIIKMNEWEDSQNRLNGITLKSLFLNYYQIWGSTFFDRIRDVTILIIASLLVVDNRLSLGVLLTISYIIGQLSGAMEHVHSFVRDFQDARYSMQRLIEIYNKEEESIEICKNDYPLKGVSIGLRNVFFRYNGLSSPYIIKGLSITLNPGSVTAIVGNSGCGKTTLLKLLLGFYKVQKGEILIGNQNINQISISEWRKRCGCVLQNGFIFSDSIANNISLGNKDVDKNRIEEVAKIACLNTFVEKFPLKYDTIIGNAGLELSGGQKQRILIARAIYKNPEFLIFDEATSSLDSEIENKIIKNLYDYFKDKTVLIIAHWLSTVVKANRILFMEDGQIIETGTHDELCSKKGKYYNLVKTQIQLL